MCGRKRVRWEWELVRCGRVGRGRGSCGSGCGCGIVNRSAAPAAARPTRPETTAKLTTSTNEVQPYRRRAQSLLSTQRGCGLGGTVRARARRGRRNRGRRAELCMRGRAAAAIGRAAAAAAAEHPRGNQVTRLLVGGEVHGAAIARVARRSCQCGHEGQHVQSGDGAAVDWRRSAGRSAHPATAAATRLLGGARTRKRLSDARARACERGGTRASCGRRCPAGALHERHAARTAAVGRSATHESRGQGEGPGRRR